jgi:hypothetical protein
LEKQRFADWSALYHALDQRRDFLNHHLPCASLGELSPLVAHPEARDYAALIGQNGRLSCSICLVSIATLLKGIGSAWPATSARSLSAVSLLSL